MNNNWQLRTIESVCLKICSGGTPRSNNSAYYYDGTIPWLKTAEVNHRRIYYTELKITEQGYNNSAAKLIPANSIIVALYGDGKTAGKAAINKIPLATNQACCNLIIDSREADYNFIYYYLFLNYQNLINLKSGGSQQNLNSQTIKKFPIYLPLLPTQRKIAAVLSAYDELIDNNNKRIVLLEKMAEEIYKEWFVRMRFPGYKETKFVKGIPEGWEEKSIGTEINLTMGQSPKSEYYNISGKGLPFNQGVGTYGKRFPKHEIFCSVNGRIANEGDILFSVRAPVGRLNIADTKMIIGRGLAAINHKRGYNSYLYYMMKSYFENEDLLGNGSIFNSVGKDELNKFKILAPSDDLLKEFEKIVLPSDLEIKNLYKQVETLRVTRDLLLPRLLSGKLSVENSDIKFPPSMENENA